MPVSFHKSLLFFVFYALTLQSPLAQWQKTVVPYGGSIQTLAAEGKLMMAGTYLHGGVYVSTNGGDSWKAAPVTTENYSVDACALVNGILYAGTTSRGVLCSADTGKSWQERNTGINNTMVYSLLCNGPEFFVCTWNEFYYSTDNCLSWIKKTIPGSDDIITAMLYANDTLFAGTQQHGLFFSTNKGAGWQQMGAGIVPDCIKSLLMDENGLYVGTGDFSLYFLPKGGTSWEHRDHGMENEHVNALVKTGNSLIAATWNGLFHSENAGMYWYHVAAGPASAQTVCLANNGNRLFTGTNTNGVFVSDDGGANWNVSNTGMGNHDIISFTSVGSKIYAGSDMGGIFSCIDSLGNWVSEKQGLKMKMVYSMAHTGTLVQAGTGSSGVYQSDAFSSSWEECNTGLDDPTINGLASTGSDMIAATNDGLYFLEEMGRTWTRIDESLPEHAFRTAGYFNHTLYASPVFGGLYSTTDFGGKWNSFSKEYSVYQLAFAGDAVYFRNPYYIFSPLAGTMDWGLLTGGFPESGINSLIEVKDHLLAGTPTGVYLFVEDSGLWKPLGDIPALKSSGEAGGKITGAGEIDGKYINQLHSNGRYLFASLRNGEVWRLRLGELAEPEHSVSPGKLSFGPTGSASEVKIISNTGWVLAHTPQWVQCSMNSGSGNASLLFNAQANPGNGLRKDTVEIRFNDGTVSRIALAQAGTTNVNENPVEDQLRVYPNPTDGMLFLEGISGDVKLILVAADGRKMLEQDSTGEINLASCPPGVYFLHIHQAGIVSVRKIVRY